MTVLTIRDIPDDVRDTLSQDARERGQSLQAFLRSILERQADFSRNRQLLVEISGEMTHGRGAGPEAPDASDVLAQARAERESSPRTAATGHGADAQ